MAHRVGVTQAIVGAAIVTAVTGTLTVPLALSLGGAFAAVNWEALTERATEWMRIRRAAPDAVPPDGEAPPAAPTGGAAAPVGRATRLAQAVSDFLTPNQTRLKTALGGYKTSLRERGIDVSVQIDALAAAAGIAVEALPNIKTEETLRTEIRDLARTMVLDSAHVDALDNAILAGWEAPRLPKANPRIALLHLLASRPDTRAKLNADLGEVAADSTVINRILRDDLFSKLTVNATVTREDVIGILNRPDLSPSFKAQVASLIGRKYTTQDPTIEAAIRAADLQALEFFMNKGMRPFPDERNIVERSSLDFSTFAAGWTLFAGMNYAAYSTVSSARSDRSVCVPFPLDAEIPEGRVLSAFITHDGETGCKIGYRQPMTGRFYEVKAGQEPAEIDEAAFRASAKGGGLIILDPSPEAIAALPRAATAEVVPPPAVPAGAAASGAGAAAAV